jgi:hypothetical protein
VSAYAEGELPRLTERGGELLMKAWHYFDDVYFSTDIRVLPSCQAVNLLFVHLYPGMERTL